MIWFEEMYEVIALERSFLTKIYYTLSSCVSWRDEPSAHCGGFAARVQVCGTSSIKRCLKFSWGCGIAAGLHMQLYVIINPESWTCHYCSSAGWSRGCFLCFGGIVPLRRSLNGLIFQRMSYTEPVCSCCLSTPPPVCIWAFTLSHPLLFWSCFAVDQQVMKK